MWADACSAIERAERLYRQLFHPLQSGASTPSWSPPVDIYETKGEVMIVAALPGAEQENLQVSVEADAVVVSGSRRLPAFARNSTIHRLEIPYGRFERRVPARTIGLQLEQAEFENGCLVLTLAKPI
jgi:HSP20 family molecular chaperone IbpA